MQIPWDFAASEALCADVIHVNTSIECKDPSDIESHFVAVDEVVFYMKASSCLTMPDIKCKTITIYTYF